MKEKKISNGEWKGDHCTIGSSFAKGRKDISTDYQQMYRTKATKCLCLCCAFGRRSCIHFRQSQLLWNSSTEKGKENKNDKRSNRIHIYIKKYNEMQCNSWRADWIFRFWCQSEKRDNEKWSQVADIREVNKIFVSLPPDRSYIPISFGRSQCKPIGPTNDRNTKILPARRLRTRIQVPQPECSPIAFSNIYSN